MHNPLISASNRILRLVCPEILQNLQSTSMVFLLAVSFIPVTPWGRYDGNWPYIAVGRGMHGAAVGDGET